MGKDWTRLTGQAAETLRGLGVTVSEAARQSLDDAVPPKQRRRLVEQAKTQAKDRLGPPARKAGEHLAAKASQLARDRGLADRDVGLDEVLERLKTLRDQGRLTPAEFAGRLKDLMARRRD